MASTVEQVQRWKHWKSEGHTKYNAKQLARRETYVITRCSEEQKNEIIKYGSCDAMYEHFDEKMKPKSVRQILQWYEEAIQKYPVREKKLWRNHFNEPNEPDYLRHPKDNNDSAYAEYLQFLKEFEKKHNFESDDGLQDYGDDSDDEFSLYRETRNPYVIDIMVKSPH